MFKKILIATDFSPASDCLIQCAAEFRLLGLERAVLAHIVYVANTPGLDDLLKNRALPEMERQKCLLEAAGIAVDAELRTGIPARELDALAAEHDVDAILIGSRGRGLAKSALGSVSFKLLQVATRPVFLSRVSVQGEGDSCHVSVCLRAFQKILFATDFSSASDRAFGFLEGIVSKLETEVILLHVQDPYSEEILSDQGLHEQEDIDRARLAELTRRLENLGGKVTAEWAVGHPDHEIINRTRAGQSTLVIMGHHGKGFFREALLGSVANEVARQAETPVLLIPDVR